MDQIVTGEGTAPSEQDAAAPSGREHDGDEDIVERPPTPHEQEHTASDAACAATTDSPAECAAQPFEAAADEDAAEPGCEICTPKVVGPVLLFAAVVGAQLGSPYIAEMIAGSDGVGTFGPAVGFAINLALGAAALALLGAGVLGKLSLRPILSFQFLMLLFAAVPAGILSLQFGRLVANLVPAECQAPSQDPGTLMHIATAIGMLCLIPAIGQELVFRGVVNRALTSRLGTVLGMALTTILFAASYIYPERIAAMFVLGLVLHLTLILTRSLFSPIVLHAGTAAMSTLILFYPDALSIPGYTHPQVSLLMPWPLLGASAFILAASLGGLYWTRTRFVTAGGDAWTPGYASQECPSRDAPIEVISPDAHSGIVFLLFLVFVGFLLTVFWENQRGAVAVEAYRAQKATDDARKALLNPADASSPAQGGGMKMPGGGMPGGGMPGGGMGGGMPGMKMPGGKGPGGKGPGGKGKGKRPPSDDGPLTKKETGDRKLPEESRSRSGDGAASRTDSAGAAPPEAIGADVLPPVREPRAIGL